MKPRPGQSRHLEELLASYGEQKEAIRARLAEFRHVAPGEYFWEMVYCLLTPQSSALHAQAAVEALRRAGCRDDADAVAAVLRRSSSYIRFHNTKAARVVRTWNGWPHIARALSDCTSSAELRAWLVANVKGLGLKEASHFLRNIGHRDLAILDRHILKNLRRHGVLRTIPKTLTVKHYVATERRFRRFAVEAGIPMDELDLLFWSRETGQILK